MFSIAKIFFFIMQSAKKYNNKKSGQKIRTADIVVAVFLLYCCAVDASTLHAARHDTTRLWQRPTFSIIFLAKGGRVRTKERIRV
jgi:NADH:ubiquinone oxidoreductase subunit B-like Fe-S oxidoreductase